MKAGSFEWSEAMKRAGESRGRLAGSVLGVGGGVGCFVGYIAHNALLIALCTIVASAGLTVADYHSKRAGSLGPLTIHAAVFGVWWGVGSSLGLILRGTAYESMFLLYADTRYLWQAQLLASLTGLVPLVAARGLGPLLERIAMPSLGGRRASGRVVLRVAFLLIAVDAVAFFVPAWTTDLGTPGRLLDMGNELAIFLVTWHLLDQRDPLPRWAWSIVFGAAAADSAYNLLFANMRGEILYPWGSIFLAFLLQRRLAKRVVFLVLSGVLPLAVAYAALGEIRGQSITGGDRVDVLRTRGATGAEVVTVSLLSLAARGSQFPQLSQIVAIVESEGHYWGRTLEYLTFAFIPRVVWPEKPSIRPGQWFAEKLGRGRSLDSGDRFSNAINMGTGGELYLNFGWLGAIGGLALIGAFYKVFWTVTGLEKQEPGLTGLIMAVVTLRLVARASSLAVLPTLVFTYLALIAVAQVVGRGPRPPGASRPLGPRRPWASSSGMSR